MSYSLVKDAGISSDILSSLKSSVVGLKDVKEKPFETIFKYLGMGAVMAFSWKLAILFGVADYFNFGLPKIGALIDKFLGYGTNKDNSITDFSLKGAATGIVDKVIGLAKNKSATFNDILIRKNGKMEVEDFIVVWAAGPTNIVGAAKWLGRIKGTGRSSFISILYGLLKMLLAGILVNTGINYIKKKTSPTTSKDDQQDYEKQKAVENPFYRRYKNINGVENSIIMLLNNMIKYKGLNFSQIFQKARGKRLRGSFEMENILNKIKEAHNWAPISVIDEYNTFVGPSPDYIAKNLLPEFNYSKELSKKKIDKDFNDIMNKSTRTRTNKPKRTKTRKTRSVREVDNEFNKMIGGLS